MRVGVVMWDFEGTLAMRPGLWSTCMLEVLDEHAPGHRATRDELRAVLRGGFPWHRASEPHPEAFRHALRASGDPPRRWMIGDNPEADVRGAQALGIPAVLIRTKGGEPDALAAAQLVIAG